MSREENSQQSPVFLKIRLAALEKAFTQVRDKRMLLDEKLDRGHLSQDDYSKSITLLITEGTQIKTEQRKIESSLGIH